MRALSFVGLQPAALATALKTWLSCRPNDSIEELCLLTTARVEREAVADRLSACARRLLPAVRVVPIAISDRLDASPDRPAARDAVRDWLAQGQEQVLFFADPGLKSLIMSVAAILPEDTIFVHGDVQRLYARSFAGGERIDRHDLADLGLAELLNLYGLRAKSNPRNVAVAFQRLLARWRSRLGKAEQGFTFLDAGGKLIGRPFDLVYERRGWVFTLTHIAGGPGAAARVRNVAAVKGRLNRLRGLQPEMGVISDSEAVRSYAREHRLTALDATNPSGLRAWLTGHPPSGPAIGLGKEPEDLRRAARDSDRDGPTLCTWIGLDPSATLISLYTHRPRRALLLYDATVPAVEAVATRLLSYANSLFADEVAGEIVLVPSDTLGTGLGDRLNEYCEGTLRADITPGRVSQACALARLPGAELWHLIGDRGEAGRLDGLPPALKLQAPALLTQARIAGGHLIAKGTKPDRSEAALRFFERLAVALAAAQADHPHLRFVPLRSVTCSAGEVVVEGNVVRVTIGRKRARGTLQHHFATVAGGLWFEELVASRLAAAGADEVRMRLEVSLYRGREVTAGRPAEAREGQGDIDVAARFGHRFCAVSAKAGTVDLGVEARLIRATAQAAVGAFALAVLAHPCPRSNVELAQITRERVTYLDLPALADTSRVREILETAFKALSTLA
jgi:hypothetical protein